MRVCVTEEFAPAVSDDGRIDGMRSVENAEKVKRSVGLPIVGGRRERECESESEEGFCAALAAGVNAGSIERVRQV